MIRACRIGPILNRICMDDKDGITCALLVTFDGEILGESTIHPQQHSQDPSFFGTLVADIASDYQRAGEDYIHIHNNHHHVDGNNNNNNNNNDDNDNNDNNEEEDEKYNHHPHGTTTTRRRRRKKQQQKKQHKNSSSSSSRHDSSHLQFLFIELEGGCIGISPCLQLDCFVMAVTQPDTPPGLLKLKLESLATFVQESLSHHEP